MVMVGISDVSSDNNDEKAMTAATPPMADPRNTKEDWIGRQLRRVFDSALNEPLPDDIMSLLERIDEEAAAPAKPPKSAE
jgi:hypothetical protein